MADPTDPSAEDLERARRIGEPIARFMRRWRARIARKPWLNTIYRVLITCIGVVVVIVGLILVPLPGPGWLIVFIGLTVLGSEFHWARRLTSWARMQLARFWVWWKQWREKRRRTREEKSRPAA